VNSSNRLRAIEQGRVRLRWRDYQHHDQQKTMTLEAPEFIRRFLLHVPPRLVPPHPPLRPSQRPNPRRETEPMPTGAGHATRLLAPALRRDYRDAYEALTGVSLRVCPVCQYDQMVRAATLPQQG